MSTTNHYPVVLTNYSVQGETSARHLYSISCSKLLKKLIFILLFIIDQNDVSNILKYSHVVHKKGYDFRYLNKSNCKNVYWSSNLCTSAIDQ